jgi:hypothetical protein
MPNSKLVSSLKLNKARRNVTSQNGEDGVIAEIFQAIGTSNKWCCEFGAWDGKHLSNTYSLIDQDEWSAVLIEGDPTKGQDLKRAFKTNPRVHPVIAFVRDKGEYSLDRILAKTNIPQDFDLLSVDIDNTDYLVWSALERYQPRVVVVEINSSIPLGVEKLPAADSKPEMCGSSFTSMVALGKRKGYELALHTGNCIFVRRELASKLDIDTERPEELFDDTWVNAKNNSFLQKAARRISRFATGA